MQASNTNKLEENPRGDSQQSLIVDVVDALRSGNDGGAPYNRRRHDGFVYKVYDIKTLEELYKFDSEAFLENLKFGVFKGVISVPGSNDMQIGVEVVHNVTDINASAAKAKAMKIDLSQNGTAIIGMDCLGLDEGRLNKETFNTLLNKASEALKVNPYSCHAGIVSMSILSFTSITDNVHDIELFTKSLINIVENNEKRIAKTR